jgi:hypothetical protein
LEFHKDFLAGRQALEQQSGEMGGTTPTHNNNNNNNMKNGSYYSNSNNNRWEDQPLPLKRSDVVPIDDDDDDEGLSEDAFASFLSSIEFVSGVDHGNTTPNDKMESIDHGDAGITIAVIPMDHDSDGDHVMDSAKEFEDQQDVGPHQPPPPQSSSSEENPNSNNSPGRFDVLLGVRGKASLQHPGNSRYCHIIGMHSQAYEAAAKYQKLEIADRVIEAIRESGGRFLKPVSSTATKTTTTTTTRTTTAGGGDGDVWEEMDNEIVLREKIAHAFRNLRRRKRQLQQELQQR